MSIPLAVARTNMIVVGTNSTRFFSSSSSQQAPPRAKPRTSPFVFGKKPSSSPSSSSTAFKSAGKPGSASSGPPPMMTKAGGYTAKIITRESLPAIAAKNRASTAEKVPMSKAPAKKSSRPSSKPVASTSYISPQAIAQSGAGGFGLAGSTPSADGADEHRKTRQEIDNFFKTMHGFTPNSVNYRLPASCLRVTNLGVKVSGEGIKDAFGTYGSVEQIRFPPTLTDAYVMFTSEKDAIGSLKALNDKTTELARSLSERLPRIDPNDPPPAPRYHPDGTPKKVFNGPRMARAEIGNFERELSGFKKINIVKEFQRTKKRIMVVHVGDHWAVRHKSEMLDMFGEYGEVQAVQPAVNGRRASVIFANADDAEACITDLDGKAVSGEHHGPLCVKASSEELEDALAKKALTAEQRGYLELDSFHHILDLRSPLPISELVAIRSAIKTLEENGCPENVADDIFKHTDKARWGEFCRDFVGNRMMSYLLRRVSQPRQAELVSFMLADFLPLSTHDSANHVIQALVKVLVRGDEGRAVVREYINNNMAELLSNRNGNYLVSLAGIHFEDNHFVLDTLVKAPSEGYTPGVIARLLVDDHVNHETKTMLIDLVLDTAKDLVHNHPKTAPLGLTWVLNNNTTSYDLSLKAKVNAVASIYKGHLEDLLLNGNFEHMRVLWALLHQRVSVDVVRQIQTELLEEGVLRRLLQDKTGQNFLRGYFASDGLQSTEKVALMKATQTALEMVGEDTRSDAAFHHIYYAMDNIEADLLRRGL
ncbi:RNA recognition motif domain [Phaffia rhodozyma]|uniref:RNA recognition motif domain n=1 Tax=Phaffia rhodozyma TaxID=264483 RepID=A0A0F7SS13_PHARH|nr:RNA recognition motif domain [Phaffia rhodozyma]